jgi:hypothetical protein
MDGWSDKELLAMVDKQNDIMDNHEDYAALRAGDTMYKAQNKTRPGKHKDKKQIAKGIKGISKLMTNTRPDDTILYPSMGALILSDFLPKSIFSNTDIVEYRNGKIRYVSDSIYAVNNTIGLEIAY